MAFISAKTIKGRVCYYLVESIRLLNGDIKKVSVYLKGYNLKREYPRLKEYKIKLAEKLEILRREDIITFYKHDFIFDKQTLEKLEQIKVGYDKIRKQLTENQLQDVLDRFTVNFTYNSNSIEGNSLTLKDVTFILHEGQVPKGSDLREVYETINTRKAFAWIFQEKPDITEANIIRLHQMLVKDTGITCGYKKLPNFLLGRMVKTTPPEKVSEEMNKLIMWYKQSKTVHPLQRASLFHGRFEKIHPFEDGNGRTGRLLINLILLHEGYPPLILRKTQRIKYFNTLAAFDTGYHDKLCRFLLEKYKETYSKFFEVYIKYLK